MWWMYALLSAFFAGLTAVLAKVGVKGVDSDLATAVRTVVILVLTWSIVLFKKTAHPAGLSRQNLLFLVLSGVATGLSWLCYFRALQLGQVSQVAPVDKASVAVAILLSAVFLHEPLTWKTAIGTLLILAGTWTLIW
jgi:transporter family protein